MVTTIAHRGFSENFPENTLLAFREAIALGADAIEFDVHQTLDGELVVMHDGDVSRTTNGTGLLKDLTFAEVQELDAGQGEHIPTLREVLELGKGKVQFQLEVKVAKIEDAIIACVEDVGVLDDTYFSSFDHGIMKAIKTLRSEAKVATLESSSPMDTPVQEEHLTKRFIKNAQKVGAMAFHPNLDNVGSRLVEEAHAAGLRVNVWTVDSEILVEELVAMGVDGIFSNRVDMLIEILQNLQGS